MNREAEILNKMLADGLQPQIKRIKHNEQVGFILGMHSHINRMKDKNHVINPKDA